MQQSLQFAKNIGCKVLYSCVIYALADIQARGAKDIKDYCPMRTQNIPFVKFNQIKISYDCGGMQWEGLRSGNMQQIPWPWIS